MKKVIAAVLVLSVAICFAACKKKDTEPTTSLPDLSADFSATQTPVPLSDTPVDSGDTILLTTQPGETQPSVATTQFVPDPAAVTALTTMANAATSQFTVPSMSTPVVTSQQSDVTYVTVSPLQPVQTSGVTQVQPTAAPTSGTTAPVGTTATTGTTTTTGTTATTAAPTTTTKPVAKPVTASVNDTGYSSKKVYVTLDGSNWNGNIKANSGNINVTIDGEKKVVPATVSGSGAGSNPQVVIDLSGVAVPEDGNMTFSIPAQFVQSSEGQYNSNTISGSSPIG